jgi:hypothetical protein
MPANTVYVGRRTKWGNPYLVNPKRSAKEAVRAYRMGVRGRWTALERLEGHSCIDMLTVIAYFQRIRRAIWAGELRGRNLACWCLLEKPCHADVLLEIANGETHR